MLACLSVFLRKKIDWFTLIVTTIVVDIEPIYVIIFKPLMYGPRGYMHTFLVSILGGAIVGLLTYLAHKWIGESLKGVGLLESANYVTSYVLASVTGWGLHVLMDSFMYFDIQPFMPIECNPLYLLIDPQLLYYVYEAVFYVGSAIYLAHLTVHLHRRGFTKSRKLIAGLIAVGLGVANLLVSPSSLIMLAIGLLMVDRGLSDLIPMQKLQACILPTLLAISILYLSMQSSPKSSEDT